MADRRLADCCSPRDRTTSTSPHRMDLDIDRRRSRVRLLARRKRDGRATDVRDASHRGSLGWQNPAVVPATISLVDVTLVIIIAVAWGGAVVGSTSKWARSGWREPVSRRSTGLFAAAAICLLATSLVMPGSWLPTFTASSSPVDGFWSAAAAALVDADRESPVNLPKLSTDSLIREYERVAYPLGMPRDTAHIASLRGP